METKRTQEEKRKKKKRSETLGCARMYAQAANSLNILIEQMIDETRNHSRSNTALLPLICITININLCTNVRKSMPPNVISISLHHLKIYIRMDDHLYY